MESGLDSLRKTDRAGNLPRDNPMEVSLFAPNFEVDLTKGEARLPDPASKISHAQNFVVALQNKQEVRNANFLICHDTTNMDRWPQRANFVKRLDEYREKTGSTISQVAILLDVSEASIYSYCTRPQSQPSEKTKKAAAALFGCSVTEFLDDPAAVPPGVDPAKWAEVSERTRVLASAMFEDLAKFPEEEQEAYYQLWLKGIAIGLATRAAEAKEKTPEGKTGGKKP